jgi:hypothetical protein
MGTVVIGVRSRSIRCTMANQKRLPTSRWCCRNGAVQPKDRLLSTLVLNTSERRQRRAAGSGGSPASEAAADDDDAASAAVLLEAVRSSSSSSSRIEGAAMPASPSAWNWKCCCSRSHTVTLVAP